MAINHHGERLLQRGNIELTLDIDTVGNIVCSAAAIHTIRQPHALLRCGYRQARAQWCRGGTIRIQWGFDPVGGIDLGSQRAEIPGLKDTAHFQVHAELFVDACEQSRGTQRVATQIKEVLVDADDVALEHLPAKLHQATFGFGLCGLHLRSRQFGAGIRIRQGIAVHLVIGGFWQTLELHHDRRDHVIVEVFAQGAAQRFYGQIRAFDRDQIGNQLLLAVNFPRDYHRIGDGRLVEKPRFHFTNLDAESADFHLKILAPAVVQQAVFFHLAEIAGVVQSQLRIFRVRGKHPVAGLAIIPVTQRQIAAAHGDLTDFAALHLVAVFIQQQDFHALDRVTQWHHFALQFRFRTDGEVAHGAGLGGAEAGIEGDIAGKCAACELDVAGQHPLPAESHQANIEHVIGAVVIPRKFAEHRRNRVVNRDAARAQPVGQVGHALDAEIVRKECSTIEQCTEDAVDGRDDTAGIKQRHAIPGRNLLQVGAAHAAVQQVAVVLDHPLGLSGRAGRIDDIGERIRADTDIQVFPGNPFGQFVQIQYLRIIAGQLSRRIAVRVIGQQQFRFRFAVNMSISRRREVGIDRHIGMATLEYGENRSDMLDALFHANGDTRRASGGHGLEDGARHAVGKLVQRAVADRGIAVGNCQPFAM